MFKSGYDIDKRSPSVLQIILQNSAVAFQKSASILEIYFLQVRIMCGSIISRSGYTSYVITGYIHSIPVISIPENGQIAAKIAINPFANALVASVSE